MTAKTKTPKLPGLTSLDALEQAIWARSGRGQRLV